MHIFFYKKALHLSRMQHMVRIELEPKRGDILDRKMRKLALSLKVDSVYAIARDVKEKRKAARSLSRALNQSEDFLYERLNRDKMFVWLARKISQEQSDKVKNLNIKGVQIIDETKRFYPNAGLACQTIGFSGIDNNGLEGIEAYYDKYLAGKKGYRVSIRDAKGREVQAFGNRHVPSINGFSVILTIDEVIQHIAEKSLAKIVAKHRANAGVALVMDPNNGDVLALAVRPSYDLNRFGTASSAQKRNRAIADYYEPGSVFKVVTAAACIDSGKVSLNDKFFCENGSWAIAGRTLHDHRGHGELTFKEVIEQSSNIGTVKAAIKLGDKDLYKYIRSFGFGSPTGVELHGEISGMLRPLNSWTKGSIAAIPIGHEIGVTMIQLAAGVSAVANGGVLFKPRIVSGIIDEDGAFIRQYYPEQVRRVIGKDTARQLRAVMKSVIETGTGSKAKLTRYAAGGKTGTAQKIEPSGKYSHRDYVASFVGFAPTDNPAITVCVMIDTPRNGYYGGTVAAPVFRDICDATLRYLRTEQEGEDEA
ncbi:MAG: penicillin-binding transpeptidase domain-containing protein [Candidatus Omnitrophica bacterium]|nr:penicillin-binding transpeptidase domain-containing protein [Candidatus Omnitrophota bacterium]